MRRFICILLCLIALTGLSAHEIPPFEDGSTVCFVGNSITQDGRYHMLLQAFHATRFPERKVKFIGCGIGGDRASDMIARFEGDVMCHNPDYAFLMTGMNDMTSALYAQNLAVTDELLEKRKNAMRTYEQLIEQLLTMMLEREIKPILLTPTIYDETAQLHTPALQGKCAALLQCAEYVRRMAKKYDVPLVELTAFMLDLNLEAQQQDPEYTIISEDRVHPKETGHFIMAYRIINTLWEGGKCVSSHTIKVKGDTTVSFTLKSKSLPFPIPKAYQEAQRFVPFIAEHNQEILSVKGLPKGRYLLSIDHVVVDTLTHSELKQGVNLARNPLTPQYKQAEKVFCLCEKYHEILAIIRSIANVEFKRLKAYTGDDSMASRRCYLDNLNEKSKGKPWYESGLKITQTYYEYKPREKQVEEELREIRTQIYYQNKPQEHTYQLSKI